MSAVPNCQEKFSSRLFYRVFDQFTDLPYQMHTERFRILSRRVINRISSMNKTVPYRKAIYASQGLKTDAIIYKAEKRAQQIKPDKHERRYRSGLAVDSLILFTELGYRFSVMMTGNNNAEYSYTPTWSEASYDVDVSPVQFVVNYIDTFLKNPIIMSRAVIDREDALWDIYLGRDSYLGCVNYYGTLDNLLQWNDYYPARRYVSLYSAMRAATTYTANSQWISAIEWRSGLFTLLGVITIVFVSFRKGMKKHLLILAPLFGQVMSLLLSTGWSDFRYYWPLNLMNAALILVVMVVLHQDTEAKGSDEMKLAVSNIGWAAQQDEAVYSIMKKYGYDGLEAAPTRIFAETPYDKLDQASVWADEMKKRFGFAVPSIQSIWYGRQEKLFGTEEERNALLDYTKQAVDFAAAIRCKNLVFGCPRNRFIPKGADPELGIMFFKTVGDYAAKKHTVIGMEANPPIYHTNYINDTAAALELIEAVDSAGFLLNLDAGTMIQNGESADELKGKVKFINHVHISEPELKVIEKRELHQQLKDVLAAENYQGFISVEMGKTDDLRVIENTLDYVKEIFGS